MKKGSYDDFVRTGGTRSGVFDTSKKEVKAYVRQYKSFIPKSDIYTRNKNGDLVPRYGRKK